MAEANNPKTDKGQKLQEEIHFYELKTLIVDSMMKQQNVSGIDMQNAVERIILSFIKGTYPELNLAPPEYTCAYVHHLGALGMGLTRFKVLEALQNCVDLGCIFRKPVVNVVCLGGGPGIDVVGLTSALYERGINSSLNITIVDKEVSWSSFVNELPAHIKNGKESEDFGNASGYFLENDVNLSFIQAELPYAVGDPARQAMMEADVILMIRFISSIKRTELLNDQHHAQHQPHAQRLTSAPWKPNIEPQEPQVITNVRENMDYGAIALVIDGEFYTGYFRKFECLYLNQYDDYYYGVRDDSTPILQNYEAGYSKSHLAVLRRNKDYEDAFGVEPDSSP